MEAFEKFTTFLVETQNEITEINKNGWNKKQYEICSNDSKEMETQFRKTQEEANSILKSLESNDFHQIFEEVVESLESIDKNNLPDILEIINECKTTIEINKKDKYVETENKDQPIKEEEEDKITIHKDDLSVNSSDEDETFIKSVMETLRGKDFKVIPKKEKTPVNERLVKVDVPENLITKSPCIKQEEDDSEDESFLRSVEKNLNSQGFKISMPCSSKFSSETPSTHIKNPLNTNTDKAFATPMNDLTNRSEHLTRGILKSANNQLSASHNITLPSHQLINHSLSNHNQSNSYSFQNNSINFAKNHLSSTTNSSKFTPLHHSSTPHFQPKNLFQLQSQISAIPANAKVTFKLTPDYKVISDDSGSTTFSDNSKQNLSQNQTLSLKKNTIPSLIDNNTYNITNKSLINGSFDSSNNVNLTNISFGSLNCHKNDSPYNIRTLKSPNERVSSYLDNRITGFMENFPKKENIPYRVTTPKNIKSPCYKEKENQNGNDGGFPSRFPSITKKESKLFGFKQYYEKKMKEIKK